MQWCLGLERIDKADKQYMFVEGTVVQESIRYPSPQILRNITVLQRLHQKVGVGHWSDAPCQKISC